MSNNDKFVSRENIIDIVRSIKRYVDGNIDSIFYEYDGSDYFDSDSSESDMTGKKSGIISSLDYNDVMDIVSDFITI